MRKVVESLKRLYEAGKLTKGQIAERLARQTITAEEYEIIIGVNK